MTIYLAGPLFSAADRAWHRATKAGIEAEAGHAAIWPFELFDQAEIAKWGADAPRRVMADCRDTLLRCDMVVALLDGA